MFEELLNKSGLSLDRLRSFLSFVQAGSIAKAAPGKVNLQSQISRQISELEEFFGAELAVRRGKTLSPSEDGRRLAARIFQQFRDLEDFQCEVQRANKSFTVGAGASILDWVVLPAIHDIRSALDGAVLSLETLRSRTLVEAVTEGRVDFAIVREDALPKGARRHPVRQIRFHLCVPRKRLKRGTPPAAVDDPKEWQSLPFTAGKDGGQLDSAIRDAMRDAGVNFRPQVLCNSMLQARQLIERGEYAGILPSVGIHGLDPRQIIIRDFAPLKNYGRHLVLHWNERQMRRRGVDSGAIEEIAKALRE